MRIIKGKAIKIAGIEDGYLFRSLSKGAKVLKAPLSPYSISVIVKKYAEMAGFNSDDFQVIVSDRVS